MSTSRKTDDASPQLKQLFSSSNALAPNHAPLSKTLFPQVIDHKEWLPQSQEPFESRMQIPKGLRINRRNRTQEMPREPTQKHPADASGNNAFPYSHSTVTRQVTACLQLAVSCPSVSPRASTWCFVIGEYFRRGALRVYSPVLTTEYTFCTQPSGSDHETLGK